MIKGNDSKLIGNYEFFVGNTLQVFYYIFSNELQMQKILLLSIRIIIMKNDNFILTHVTFFPSEPSADRDQVLLHANRLLRKRFNIASCTIQIERYQPEVMDSCVQCQPLSC